MCLSLFEFRSSSTIVKQAGLFDTSGANSLKMPQLQSIDDRWGPGFPDGNASQHIILLPHVYVHDDKEDRFLMNLLFPLYL